MNTEVEGAMTPPPETEPVEGQLANLACQNCRRRKVKCDRGLPCCTICINQGQPCRYPAGPMKPGPKIGVSSWVQKRARDERGQGGRNGGQARRRKTSNTDPKINAQQRKNSSVSGEPNITETYGPLSPETSPSAATTKQEGRTLNAPSLSWIVHPSHDSSDGCSQIEEALGLRAPLRSDKTAQGGSVLSSDDLTLQFRYALRTSPDMVQRLIDAYFDNMTSFSLFSRPEFEKKLRTIASPTQLHALLAAMFSFSARFLPDIDDQTGNANTSTSSSDWYLNLALHFVDEALNECEDETPPLTLLQALILTTFQQLIKGVRGKAWRSLGLCVRIAYELQLHAIDSDRNRNQCTRAPAPPSPPPSSAMPGPPPQMGTMQGDVSQWCLDEERRRAWWAIWEFDVFASTIRRAPTAIDWSQNETLLPIDDECWFAQKPQPSCFLELDPIKRWKSLQRSGNQSSKAWFIVVNSFMRDAQLLSTASGAAAYSWRCGDSSSNLELLTNSLRCFAAALPRSLAYQNEHLSFSGPDPATAAAVRRRDSAKHSIYLMIQLTYIMIYHREVFGDVLQESSVVGKCAQGCFRHWDEEAQSRARMMPTEKQNQVPGFETRSEHGDKALRRYTEAADRIFTIVSNTSDEHVRYVNPFLASTIWLAAAAELVFKLFGPEDSSKRLIETKFDLLRLNFHQYVMHWSTAEVLKDRLDNLEAQMCQLLQPHARAMAAISQQQQQQQAPPQQAPPPTSKPHPRRASTIKKAESPRLDLQNVDACHAAATAGAANSTATTHAGPPPIFENSEFTSSLLDQSHMESKSSPLQQQQTHSPHDSNDQQQQSSTTPHTNAPTATSSSIIIPHQHPTPASTDAGPPLSASPKSLHTQQVPQPQTDFFLPDAPGPNNPSATGMVGAPHGGPTGNEPSSVTGLLDHDVGLLDELCQDFPFVSGHGLQSYFEELFTGTHAG